MTHFWKKTIALALAACSLLGLCLPAVPAASAADYQFPGYGDTADLGIVLKGSPNISGQVEIVEKDGRQYVGVPIKGGKFYVFGLTDYLEGKKNAKGNYIYAELDSNIGIPRGIALDSKGTFYATGDSKSVFWYNINTGKSGQITAGSSGLTTVAVDENDNIYAVGSSGVYRIDGKTLTSEKIYSSSDYTTIQGVACGGGKVYIQGPLKNEKGGGSEVRMLSDKGDVLASYSLPGSGASYYLSYVDGVVFVGTSASSTDGLVALDTAGNKLTLMNLGNQNPIRGFVTAPYQGKSYMCLAEDGTYEYDVATRKLSRKVSGTCNRDLRARNYVRNGSDMLLLSVGPSSMTTISGPSKSTVKLNNLLEGSGSIYSARSMVPGVAGTGVAVYVGAYLSGSVGSYSPNASTPVNSSVFSNGHAQTDNMIEYKGKIYAGVYSGAYLVEYDPATNTTRELIHGLKDDYHQLRIHGLAAGDDKIFFSTIPEDQTLGGAIGWYDLKTEQFYCERNVVKDQSVIALAYDEARNILYGGTTIRGGTNTTPTADQAVLMAYDVSAKKVLATTKVNNLTGDKPKNISGIAQDPHTGKFWGMVSHTLFSFAYEGGSLKVTQEWKAATTPGDPYPDGASKSWFPRPIVFDGKGHMYIGMNETKYGIMQFSLGADGKVEKAESVCDDTTRIYTIGADGNLYYHSGTLNVIYLTDRVAVVKKLIDNANAADARKAYDSLTFAEKNQLGSTYYNKLLALEGEGDVPEMSPEEEVINAIYAIGKVTASSGPAIQNARQAYDSLTEAQKKNVTNAQTLFNAEETYKFILEHNDAETDTDTQPGLDDPQLSPEKEVINAIDAIGTVTLESGPAIQDARYMYDQLTYAEQQKVTNYQVLFEAELAFATLVSQGEQNPEGGETTPTTPTEPTEPGTETQPTVPGTETQPTVPNNPDVDNAVISVQIQINAIGQVSIGSGPVIQSARESYDALTPEQQAKVENYQLLVDAEEALKNLPQKDDAPIGNGDDADDDNDIPLYILVVAGVFVAVLAAILIPTLIKKKKAAAAVPAEEIPADAVTEEVVAAAEEAVAEE